MNKYFQISLFLILVLTLGAGLTTSIGLWDCGDITGDDCIGTAFCAGGAFYDLPDLCAGFCKDVVGPGRIDTYIIICMPD